MSWRDELRPASFRGAPFFVRSSSGTFGRRGVVHEYPFRDTPFVEDVGRRARDLRIEALVIGNDYMARRDAIIEAAETPGPGRLVHPYYGELTVSLTDGGLTVEESTDQGGMARISFSVIESGEATFPAATTATQDVLRSRADSASSTAIDAFKRRFNLDKLTGWAQSSAFATAARWIDFVKTTVAPIANAAMRGDVLALVGVLGPQLALQLYDGLAFGRSVMSIFSRFRSDDQDEGAKAGDNEFSVDVASPTEALTALKAFAAFGAAEPTYIESTPTRQSEARNQAAIIELVRAGAAIERARAIAEFEFNDYQQAIALRDSVVQQLDAVADTTPDDELYAALHAVRAAVVRDVAERGANLATLIKVKRIADTPALIVAYDLYDDAMRDDEVIARNHIQHPGFIPAGLMLEVIDE